MKILFLVVTSKTHIHQHVLHIDRVDLTRKLDAINTWVVDVLNKGHDVIFFDGGNDIEWYDENSKTLHLTEDDGYETKELSTLFPKVKAALKWAINNRDFDILYLCDDDIYINIEQFLKIEMNYDYMGTGSYGGAGFFFTKKSIKTVLNYENLIYRVCDQAIYDAIYNDLSITKNLDYNKSAVQYIPGELYATIHYVTGKRSYFLNNILRFFNENGYTNRKIILGGELESHKSNDVVSYESIIGKKTQRWYDFTVDPNGWEYHGGYIRSHLVFNTLMGFWPYAEKATKYFVINVDVVLSDFINTDIFYSNLNKLVNECEKSLIDEKNLFLCSKKFREIDGWSIDNDIKQKYKLNFESLNDYNYFKKK
jgi:hypothetical protein